MYQADQLPLSDIVWNGRKPNVALAVAIITASATGNSNMPYRAEPDFASVLVKAYDKYLKACATVDRKRPGAFNANYLKLVHFCREGLFLGR
jgi:hypothetical protein